MIWGEPEQVLKTRSSIIYSLILYVILYSNGLMCMLEHHVLNVAGKGHQCHNDLYCVIVILGCESV